MEQEHLLIRDPTRLTRHLHLNARVCPTFLGLTTSAERTRDFRLWWRTRRTRSTSRVWPKRGSRNFDFFFFVIRNFDFWLLESHDADKHKLSSLQVLIHSFQFPSSIFYLSIIIIFGAFCFLVCFNDLRYLYLKQILFYRCRFVFINFI